MHLTLADWDARIAEWRLAHPGASLLEAALNARTMVDLFNESLFKDDLNVVRAVMMYSYAHDSIVVGKGLTPATLDVHVIIDNRVADDTLDIAEIGCRASAA